MAGRKGKRVVMLGLVLALAAVGATLWTFRVEVTRAAWSLYWRWKNVPGTLGIVVQQESSRPGVQIKAITAPGPANAGLAPEDIVLEVDGKAVRTLDDLGEALQGRRAGERLHFLLRRGEEDKPVDVTLQPRG